MLNAVRMSRESPFDCDRWADLESFSDSLPIAVMAIDCDHRVRIWNRALEQLTGAPAKDVLNTTRGWSCFYEHERPTLADLVIDAQVDQRVVELYGGRAYNVENPDAPRIEGYFPDLPGGGRWLSFMAAPWRDQDGTLLGAIEIFRDISYRKAIEQERHISETRLNHILANLEHRTTHDVLTGLPNRTLVFDRLGQAMGMSGRAPRPVSLMFLDLDGFKFVNDTMGHHIGDELLRHTAKRLSHCLRDGDTLGRLSGDEFLILLPDLSERAAVAAIAQRIIETFEEPFHLADQQVRLSISIGIAAAPEDGQDPDTLVRHADAAMYGSKESGRGRFTFFGGASGTILKEQLAIKKHLSRALERREFELHFQPKSDLASGRIIGAEALLRWNNAEIGPIGPNKFVPILEESGLITTVGEWTIEEACRQLKLWHGLGHTALSVAVNLSPRQLWQPDLAERIKRILDRHGVDPRKFEIEITETMLMRERDQAYEVLSALARYGVRLALDDFGTGYSSLSYLRRFPIHAIKIDRSFIENLPNDPDDLEIVRTIVSMGSNLRRQVIAEGVETEAQRAVLTTIGCDAMQGYLLSPPLSPTKFVQFLNQTLRS